VNLGRLTWNALELLAQGCRGTDDDGLEHDHHLCSAFDGRLGSSIKFFRCVPYLEDAAARDCILGDASGQCRLISIVCLNLYNLSCLYRKSDSGIMVMKSAEDGRRYDAAHVLDGAMDWSIFAKRSMSPQLVIIGGIFRQNPA
jgi:hypothetical protein